MSNENASGIVRGTTPTIQMSFQTIDVGTISEAYLTIRQEATGLVIEKDLSDALRGEGVLSWTLTQEETLQIKPPYSVQIQCRYLLSDGTAGASQIYTVYPYQILKDGVI